MPVGRGPARLWVNLADTIGVRTNPVPVGRGPARVAPAAQPRRRGGVAVRYHYDLSDEFYALWLDRRLTYSCAYFRTGAEDIDAAQEAKLDLICRKLRLQPSERLLDVGCGWGSLLVFAAERYGVDATGVTLSARQAALARERIATAGLGDYRQLAGGPFDKVASVGMFEHVGRARLPEYFRTVRRRLAPGGLFLNHGIALQHGFRTAAGHAVDRRVADRTSFIQRHIFPDGELVPLSEALGAAERAGWEVRDVESLREHYTRTLRLWGERLAAHRDEAERLVGAETYRAWRLYFAGSARNFAREHLSVYQVLLARPDADGAVRLPPTREDIYRVRAGVAEDGR